MMEHHPTCGSLRRGSLNQAFHTLANVFNHSVESYLTSTSTPPSPAPLRSAMKHGSALRSISLEDLSSSSRPKLESSSWQVGKVMGKEESKLWPSSESPLSSDQEYAPETCGRKTNLKEQQSSREAIFEDEESSPIIESLTEPSKQNHDNPLLVVNGLALSPLLRIDVPETTGSIECVACNHTSYAPQAQCLARHTLFHDNKKVHFADIDGKNLVQLQQYDQLDKGIHHMTLGQSDPLGCHNKILIPLFRQPVTFSDFLERVLLHKVCLETALPDVDHLGIRGVVRVLNMAFQKAVYVRWSVDHWESMCEYRIAYLEGSDNNATDRFRFDICAPLKVGEKLEFAVRYECLGKMYWDNNQGVNYRIIACDAKENKKDACWHWT